MIQLRFNSNKELIDTLWNVNVSSYNAHMTVVFELIDTLWNVNEDVLQELADMVDELIDTLWNVN